MPVWTVIGRLTDDESWFIPTACYRGEREELVPMAPQGGFAVITNAPDSRSAKRQATFTYAKYAAGQLSFELEIRQQTDSGPTARTTARRGRSWWPWSRAVEAAPVEHLGNFPII